MHIYLLWVVSNGAGTLSTKVTEKGHRIELSRPSAGMLFRQCKEERYQPQSAAIIARGICRGKNERA